ncbi:WD repeat-containing protein WDS, partial [Tanacetum coccineum]
MENLPTMIGSKGLIKRHEFVRILIQCLYSLGYEKSAACLELESGISCKSSEFKSLESLVLGADWESCLDNICGIKEMTDEQRDAALFLVCQQFLLECSGRGDDLLALSVLRKQVSKLQMGKDKVHKLAFSLFSLGELGLDKAHDGVDVPQDLREKLINELEKLLPPPMTLPDRRLEYLVDTVVGSQIDSCIYHNSLDPVSIYKDHRCGRDQIPTETVQ